MDGWSISMRTSNNRLQWGRLLVSFRSTRARAAGFTNNQLTSKQYVPRRQVAIVDPVEHDSERDSANVPTGLTLCRQRHGKKGSILHIVDSNNPNVVGNASIEFRQRMHQFARREIVRAKERIRPILL